MTPHRQRRAGGAKLFKCETSGGWIWPWVMDSALPRGRGSGLCSLSALFMLLWGALPRGLAVSGVSVCFPCQTSNSCSSSFSWGWAEWPQQHRQLCVTWMIYRAVMVSQELCLASHTQDLIRPFPLPLGGNSCCYPWGLESPSLSKVVQVVRAELVYRPGLIALCHLFSWIWRTLLVPALLARGCVTSGSQSHHFGPLVSAL